MTTSGQFSDLSHTQVKLTNSSSQLCRESPIVVLIIVCLCSEEMSHVCSQAVALFYSIFLDIAPTTFSSLTSLLTFAFDPENDELSNSGGQWTESRKCTSRQLRAIVGNCEFPHLLGIYSVLPFDPCALLHCTSAS